MTKLELSKKIATEFYFGNKTGARELYLKYKKLGGKRQFFDIILKFK